MARVKVEHDELIRTEAQKEYDYARRLVFGRGALWSIITMIAGGTVTLILAHYFGWFGRPDLNPTRVHDFRMGMLVLSIIAIFALMPGTIMVYRRYLVRVSKRKMNG